MASNEDYEIPDTINQIENFFNKKVLREDIMELHERVMNDCKDFKEMFLKNVKYIERSLSQELDTKGKPVKQSDEEFNKILYSMPSDKEYKKLMKIRSQQIE